MITFEEKFNFVERVKKLPAEAMTLLMNILREVCPQAVITKDPKKMQIQIDAFDKQTLVVLHEKLDTLMGKSDPVSNEDHSVETPDKNMQSE